MKAKELLLQWFTIFLMKDLQVVLCRYTRPDKSAVKSKTMSNQRLAEELQQPIIKKSEKYKVYSSFEDNICGADLADMKLISKYNKRFQHLLCVISKHAWVVPLEDKKVTELLHFFFYNQLSK